MTRQYQLGSARQYLTYFDTAEANLDEAIRGSWENIDTSRVLAALVSRCALPSDDGKLFRRVLVPKGLVFFINLESGKTSAGRF